MSEKDWLSETGGTATGLSHLEIHDSEDSDQFYLVLRSDMNGRVLYSVPHSTQSLLNHAQECLRVIAEAKKAPDTKA